MKKYLPSLSSLPFILAAISATAAFAQMAADRSKQKAAIEASSMKSADVEWGALNPARGDKGPRAGGLWNDRTQNQASGFLVRFKDGFSSPPHIHNVTYRGVVISGLVHNDDPDAAKMWMPAGSFWTQPAGEVHITAARGKDVVAYIEIDSGPYLVLPKEQAFDKGERPVNLDPSNLVWLRAPQSTWIRNSEKAASAGSPEIAFLWGTPAKNHTHGSFLRLPKGFKGRLVCEGQSMRVVVVKGNLLHESPKGGTGTTNQQPLQAGEYFGIGQSGSANLQCKNNNGTTLYIRSLGTYHLTDS